ncbi:hypothetical protein I4I73_28930 [Pseudonocardia sp. KRD-184]|uniref:5,10-methylene-tetrahydrofolate dehydrogenase/Methenyl tetrahydrofolate cyclohydrolase n=1 Tax=Pseudonocardia oceani TaxID=2792013 RepID=A0ABS6UE31_9PSEU|nr:hypothetical protein [Pseudonocardia oceani]MBW0093253.1 hypothetical protein [Pseudonocardia oceani]MBW0100009.1 hypothetical protein [Pseudonocardia oceani]MBW0112676.1 hypothetical protein [Pseudonocardia oceani]MBW0121984.1 hypothetical protein [Pseudonocardia oceani]MBW0130486.1 hypothetical protein [Pseudonocardia oceani]
MTGPGDTPHPRRNVVVGLLADPGLPAVAAQRIAQTLPARLTDEIDDDVDWAVDVVLEPFEVAPDADRVIDKARRRVQGTRWDVAVCLTDIALLADAGPVVAQLGHADRVALVSLPALGGLRLRRRLADLVVALVAEVGVTGVGPPGPSPVRLARLARRATPGSNDIDLELVLHPGHGRARLLAGMVRANQPWQLTLGLSTALAGAATGSVFGILYSSVWSLAVAMEPWRLAVATTAALAVFVVWLIAGHDLWERRSAGLRLRPLLNLGTGLTVVCGVLLFYAILVAANILATGLLLPPEHLASVLGRPIDPAVYLRIALMASVLGLVAGAVGSGLEKDETVRQAAYSTREQQRRRQLGDAG